MELSQSSAKPVGAQMMSEPLRSEGSRWPSLISPREDQETLSLGLRKQGTGPAGPWHPLGTCADASRIAWASPLLPDPQGLGPQRGQLPRKRRAMKGPARPAVTSRDGYLSQELIPRGLAKVPQRQRWELMPPDTPNESQDQGLQVGRCGEIGGCPSHSIKLAFRLKPEGPGHLSPGPHISAVTGTVTG